MTSIWTSHIFIADLSDYQVETMVHLAGINKGLDLDWTDDNGLMEHFMEMEGKGGNSIPRSTNICQ